MGGGQGEREESTSVPLLLVFSLEVENHCVGKGEARLGLWWLMGRRDGAGGRSRGKEGAGDGEAEEIHSVERTQFCTVCSCVLNVHPGV